jgi:hypothetical protein
MQKISWETHEYFHTEKSNDWYWIVGIVTLSIAVIAVILNNIIFGILIIVASFTLSLFASRKPDVVTVTLDNVGVTFGRTRYPYANLESFWFETRDAHPRLLLKSNKLFMPFVVIHANMDDYEDIREYLSYHLKEEEHTEPILEKVLIYLGF